MEEEFASVDTATVIKGFLSSRDPRPPCIPKEIGFHQALAKSPATLPSWITEEDVHYFAEKLKRNRLHWRIELLPKSGQVRILFNCSRINQRFQGFLVFLLLTLLLVFLLIFLILAVM